jgi:hypothetical protein
MSRNASGTYTLPSGNPVVSGTLIEASWANTTLSDLATAMTDSLSRSGQGGMTAAFRAFDGTSTVPGIAWGSETTSGWYRAGAGDMRLVVTGSEVMKYLATGVSITGTLGVSSNATVGGTLSVTGAMTLTANPTLSAGTANGVAYLNGSKVLTTGSALTFDGTYLTVPDQIVYKYAGVNKGYVGGTSSRFLVASDGTTPIGFDINGSEQMRLTSTGLGIGTSSPLSKLTVQTQTSARLSVRTSDAVFGTVTGGNAIDSLNASDAALVPLGLRGNGVYINDGTGTTTFASGNLGLGVTPSAWTAAWKVFQNQGGFFGSSATNNLRTANNSYSDGTNWRYVNTGSAAAYQITDNTHQWYTAPSGTAGNAISFSQSMTLDSSGNLLVGTTSTLGKLAVVGSGAIGYFQQTASGNYCITTNAFNNGGTYYHAAWNAAGSGVGSITSTTTTTSYNTSSDYRLKENIQPMTGALAKVAALKPCTYKWKADGSDGEGFIAHELAEVVPQCVTGEKDAVDTEGNPVYQGIDTSFLVATLTAAIQEQQALIQQLQAQLTAVSTDVAALKAAA